MNAPYSLMRLAPLACLVVGLFTVSAHAQTSDQCAVPARFSSQAFPTPPIDHTRSFKELAVLGTKPVAAGDAELGHVAVRTRIKVTPRRDCEGLDVRLEFEDLVLRLAKELPENSCGYTHVLNHENNHVRIYRDIARQFARLSLPLNSSTAPEAVLAYARAQLVKLQEQHTRFDSPEEYDKNNTVCSGTIARIVQINLH